MFQQHSSDIPTCKEISSSGLTNWESQWLHSFGAGVTAQHDAMIGAFMYTGVSHSPHPEPGREQKRKGVSSAT